MATSYKAGLDERKDCRQGMRDTHDDGMDRKGWTDEMISDDSQGESPDKIEWADNAGIVRADRNEGGRKLVKMGRKCRRLVQKKMAIDFRMVRRLKMENAKQCWPMYSFLSAVCLKGAL